VIAIPGLQLLNQEWGLIPTRSGIYDVEINGRPVSNETAIRYFVGTGLAFWFVALLFGAKFFLNWRHNRTISTKDV
jgi:hypothetical protein